jgi:hypothetical protein
MSNYKRPGVQEAWTAKAASRPRSTPAIPTTVDPAAKLAAIRDNAQRKRHKTKPRQPEEN